MRYSPSLSPDTSEMRDAAFTRVQTGNVNHNVDRIGNVLSRDAGRQIDTSQGDHQFQSVESFACVIGVHGTHRTIMAGVHRLQHVQHFTATGFADDDAVRSHP